MAEETGLVRSIVDDAIRVIKGPAAFYRQMPKDGGFGKPVLFLSAMTFAGFFILLISKAYVLHPSGLVGGLIMFIVIPTIIILLSFLCAALLHAIWKVLGSSESYETAYRCMAYSYAVLPIASLLVLMPTIGAIISTLWILYIIVSASVHVHKIRPALAWLVLGLIALVFMAVNVSYTVGSKRATSKLSEKAYELEQHLSEENKKVKESKE
ncbi:MAG: YIP1 family protein [Nitrospirota bacterium]|nr:MAG: YIP1 family protein [Nitrospirota bacterium]